MNQEQNQRGSHGPSISMFGLEIPGRLELKEKYKLSCGAEREYCIVYTGSFHKYFKFLQEKPQAKRQGRSSNSDKHADDHREYLYRTDSGFTGGTFNDLVSENVSLDGYNQMRKKIAAEKVWKEIANKFDAAMQRKRVRSEHDGEFDFDKKWDTQPFQRRSYRKQNTRIVKITVESSFSCGVSADRINDFGCFVSSIINLIESNGTQCEIIAAYTGRDFVSAHKYTESPIYQFKMQVKKADEYLPVSQLLKVFSSVWYRRAKFAMIVAAAEFAEGRVCGSLGIPWSFEKVWEIRGNEVFIYSLPQENDKSKILEGLSKLLGVTTEEEQKAQAGKIEVGIPF